MYSTANAFHRRERAGKIQLLKEAGTERGVLYKGRYCKYNCRCSPEIVASISDTGPCIDSEILPRLFIKFATKSTTGTGLGLFISKSIIDAHDGRIWGKDNYPEGKGATFGFSLPLHNKFEV